MATFDVPQNIFALLLMSLLIGAIVTYVLSRFSPKIPYTVVVFVLALLFPPSLHYFIDRPEDRLFSVGMWNQMPSDLILFLFLPALLFGEAMLLNFHLAQEVFPASLLLAIPGAIFGTLTVAIMVKICFPYNWTWHLSFLFGAIVSAADPVGKYWQILCYERNTFAHSLSFQ